MYDIIKQAPDGVEEYAHAHIESAALEMAQDCANRHGCGVAVQCNGQVVFIAIPQAKPERLRGLDALLPAPKVEPAAKRK